MLNKHNHVANQELVVKSMGKSTIIVDMTAGLGRDAIVLASTGRSVICIEENLVLHLLQQDALNKLHVTQPKLASRIHLLHGVALAS